jgi:hypothetical protein
VTYHDAVELFSDKCKHMRTIPLDGRSNIALIRTKSAYNKFHSFCNEIATADDVLNKQELIHNPIVTDNEASVNTEERTAALTIVEEDDHDEAQLVPRQLHPDIPNDAFVLLAIERPKCSTGGARHAV